jgi:hypothetical protein
VTKRVDRPGIEQTHSLIQPYIRVTPVVNLTGEDFGLQGGQPVDAPADGIAADSLAPRRVGALMSRSRRRTSPAWFW